MIRYVDLKCNTAQSIIAAKFHLGLAKAIAFLAEHICHHNQDVKIKQVPSNDGGLSLGQGAIAVAKFVNN